MEKIRKYDIEWIRFRDDMYFVNNLDDARKCGIYCGVTEEQLNNPSRLKRISANEKYWEKYLEKKEVK